MLSRRVESCPTRNRKGEMQLPDCSRSQIENKCPKSGQIESGIRLAVGFGSPAGSSAFGSGTEFEAEHSESFLAGLDEELAEKYFAEARHVKRMAAHFDAGAIRFDTFDDRAKENSVYVGRLEDVIGAERILGYFPEIAAFLEGRFRSFVG